MNPLIISQRCQGFVTVTILASLFSCVEPIDFHPQSDVISSLTVSGKLVYSNPSIVTVAVGRVLDYNPTPTEGVDMRAAYLFDDQGNEVQIPEVGIGKYALTIPPGAPDIEIMTGHSYGIRLESNTGKQYISTPQEILPVPATEQLTYEPSTRRVLDASGFFFNVPYINFYLNTKILNPTSGEPAFLHWQIELTSKFNDAKTHVCYRTQSINDNQIRILNGYEYTTDEASIPIYESSLYSSYAHGSYLHVIQEPIPAEAYEYWKSVRTVLARSEICLKYRPVKCVVIFTTPMTPKKMYSDFSTPLRRIPSGFMSTRQGLTRSVLIALPRDRMVPVFLIAVIAPVTRLQQ